MKVSELLKKLHDDGWTLIDQVGSHRHFKHPVKKGKVTVAGKPSLEIHPKTLKTIYRQAQWIE